MKATGIALLLALIVVMGLALWQGTSVFKEGLQTSTRQLLGFLPVIVIAILLAGFAEALLPKNLIENWLTDAAGYRGIAIAWLAGILTPGGSIVGLPLIASLYGAGAGRAVLVTYATSLATLSFLRIPLEVGFYGWKLTLLRITASLVLPFVAGAITLVIGRFFYP